MPSAPRHDVPVPGSHLAQFFDSVESQVGEVSRYIANGLAAGDRVVVVLHERRWDAVSKRLRMAGHDPDDAQQSGALIVRETGSMLRLLTRRGRPDPELFDQHVGHLVRTLEQRGAHLRIYGEIVDYLAVRGDYRSAIQLEELWNGLAERHTFTLFCGYSSVSFGDPRRADTLKSICCVHSHVRADERDPLASFLLDAHS